MNRWSEEEKRTGEGRNEKTLEGGKNTAEELKKARRYTQGYNFKIKQERKHKNNKKQNCDKSRVCFRAAVSNLLHHRLISCKTLFYRPRGEYMVVKYNFLLPDSPSVCPVYSVTYYGNIL